jgi:hypothetical protein
LSIDFHQWVTSISEMGRRYVKRLVKGRPRGFVLEADGSLSLEILNRWNIAFIFVERALVGFCLEVWWCD